MTTLEFKLEYAPKTEHGEGAKIEYDSPFELFQEVSTGIFTQVETMEKEAVWGEKYEHCDWTSWNWKDHSKILEKIKKFCNNTGVNFKVDFCGYDLYCPIILGHFGNDYPSSTMIKPFEVEID